MTDFYIIKQPKKPKVLCACRKELYSIDKPRDTVVECRTCGQFWQRKGAYRGECLWTDAPIRRMWTNFKRWWDRL